VKRDDVGFKPVWVSVISAGRPANVPKMTALVGAATWYVPEADVAAYAAAGAASVVGSGALCRSRNHALDDAFAAGLVCVQLSDDLSRIKKAVHSTTTPPKVVGVDITFAAAVDEISSLMSAVGAELGGCAPTNNPFFSNPDRPCGTHHFIVGDFVVVKPTVLRFDESLRLKEDYDYTLQHLACVGVVARANTVLTHFAHRTNKGGAVAVRTPELEQASIRQLRERWGDKIRDNPKRPNEILMRWP